MLWTDCSNDGYCYSYHQFCMPMVHLFTNHNHLMKRRKTSYSPCSLKRPRVVIIITEQIASCLFLFMILEQASCAEPCQNDQPPVYNQYFTTCCYYSRKTTTLCKNKKPQLWKWRLFADHTLHMCLARPLSRVWRGCSKNEYWQITIIIKMHYRFSIL